MTQSPESTPSPGRWPSSSCLGFWLWLRRCWAARSSKEQSATGSSVLDGAREDAQGGHHSSPGGCITGPSEWGRNDPFTWPRSDGLNWPQSTMLGELDWDGPGRHAMDECPTRSVLTWAAVAPMGGAADGLFERARYSSHAAR